MTEKRFFKGIIDSTVTQYKHNGIAYVPYVDSPGNDLHCQISFLYQGN